MQQGIDMILLTWVKDIQKACIYKGPDMALKMIFQPSSNRTGGQAHRHSPDRRHCSLGTRGHVPADSSNQDTLRAASQEYVHCRLSRNHGAHYAV